MPEGAFLEGLLSRDRRGAVLLLLFNSQWSIGQVIRLEQ